MPEKTTAQKLLIKDNYKVSILNAPAGYESTLGDLPSNVSCVSNPNEPVDLIQFFVTSREELEGQLKKLKQILKPQGLLWVTYPKGTSKIKADINRDSIREYGLTVGLQAVAMISVDDTWSALRLKVV